MNLDVKRYDRQIALPQIDLDGQEALCNAHVIIVGVGGLGCAAAQSIVLMGIAELTLIDPDTVDKSNLARQPLFNDSNIGQNKVDVAKKTLTMLNPSVLIHTVVSHFHDEQLDTEKGNHNKIDLVLDCTDNLQTRLSINGACTNRSVPLIIGAAIRFEGMLTCVIPGTANPCYQCLAKVWPDPNETCVERGIFGPVVSLIGQYQALLAGQMLVGLPTLQPGNVQFFDGLSHSWTSLTYKQSPDCSACSQKQ